MPANVLLRNNVRDLGSGTQPMVFAHGFGCDQNMWRLVAPAFEADYRVVLFDYAGHGGSDRSSYDARRYRSLDGFAQDLLDVVHALDLRDVIVVAHSVSSMIAILAITREPERFSQLVMIGPSPHYLNDGAYRGGFEEADIRGLLDMMDKNYVVWANAFAPMVIQDDARTDLSSELTTSFCSTDPVVARQFAEVTFLSDNRSDLPALPVPSLVLQCAEDAIAPAAVGRYVARETPNATFRELQATGHCPQLSHPEETIMAIRDYLAQPAAV